MHSPPDPVQAPWSSPRAGTLAHRFDVALVLCALLRLIPSLIAERHPFLRVHPTLILALPLAWALSRRLRPWTVVAIALLAVAVLHGGAAALHPNRPVTRLLTALNDRLEMHDLVGPTVCDVVCRWELGDGRVETTLLASVLLALAHALRRSARRPILDAVLPRALVSSVLLLTLSSVHPWCRLGVGRDHGIPGLEQALVPAPHWFALDIPLALVGMVAASSAWGASLLRLHRLRELTRDAGALRMLRPLEREDDVLPALDDTPVGHTLCAEPEGARIPFRGGERRRPGSLRVPAWSWRLLPIPVLVTVMLFGWGVMAGAMLMFLA